MQAKDKFVFGASYTHLSSSALPSIVIWMPNRLLTVGVGRLKVSPIEGFPASFPGAITEPGCDGVSDFRLLPSSAWLIKPEGRPVVAPRDPWGCASPPVPGV